MTAPQPNSYVEYLLGYLIPYFTGVTSDLNAARAEALETLASYGARTRAEMLNAVQIIILGFATLEMLDEAKTTAMSASMRLRFRGCANNLNRNGQKTEQTLLKRLACDPPAPTEQEPVNDLSIPQAEEALQQTQAKVDTYRHRLSFHRPAHGPQSHTHPNKPPRRGTIMDTFAAMTIPAQPAAPARPGCFVVEQSAP